MSPLFSSAVIALVSRAHMRWLVLCVIISVAPVKVISADDQHPLSVTAGLPDGEQIDVTVYPASGDFLVLIFPSTGQLNERHRQLAASLAEQGTEAWLADLTQALFLPPGSNSLYQIDGRHVAALIDTAHTRTGKRIFVLSSHYGAIPVLRGVHVWRATRSRPGALAGVVMIAPSLFRQVPALGDDIEYLPVVDVTAVPTMIFQSERHPTRARLPELLARLERSGSPVFFTLLQDANALFFPGDTTPGTVAGIERLPGMLARILPLLATYGTPAAGKELAQTASTVRRPLDIQLEPYRGIVQPRPIELADVNNVVHSIRDYRGKVTLLNFWASWCPPCVNEIPSFNQLRQTMTGKAFQLISINYAEDRATIRDFLQSVRVDFPVLLDPAGEVAADWKVFAFPSTYVIGPDGRIRYGVNAAIDWHSEAVIKALEALLPDGN